MLILLGVNDNVEEGKMRKIKNLIFAVLSLALVTSLYADSALDFVDPIQYVEISGMNNVFHFNGTFSAWINPFSADFNGRIAFQENEWEIYTSDQSKKYIALSFVKYYANNPLIISTENVIPKKEWSHIAVSFEGKNAVIYINGEKVEQIVLSKANGKAVISQNKNLLIGNSNNFQNFDGQIDEIRFWNVDRTQTQIKENMNYNVNVKEKGLVGYWKFNENEGTISFDETSNHHHANLINFNAETSWVDSNVEINKKEETLRKANNDLINEQNLILFQNAPNPMKTNTMIKFQVKKSATCELNVYNAKGEKIVKLFKDQVQNNEIVTVSWNGKNSEGREVAAGFYLYKINTEGYSCTKKLIIMK